jgi:glucose/arabinose dehydrogenase
MLLAAVPGLLLACNGNDGAAAQANGSSATSSEAARPFQATPVAQFEEPWAMVFLPDGRQLVTEKKGALRILNRDGTIGTIAGVPAVAYSGQGGLLDVTLSPDFASDNLVYLSFSEPGTGDDSSLAVARGRLVLAGNGGRLDAVQVVWRQMPKGGGGQFGGIVTFSPDGKYMFVTSGDRMRKTPAQDPDQALGKILRLTPDGQAAPGNPDAAAGGVRAQTWTSGHRNQYGLAFAPDGRLWEVEMGPQGGDELNLVEPGRNYGWPVVSNGDDYDGTPIPDHPTRPEFQPPVLWWNPSISPSSVMIYTGDMFPQWKGSAFIGALSGQALIRATLDGGTARKADQFEMSERIRSVVQGPDGAIWLLEDGPEGKLLKLTPAG